jgi:hypothetical protein
MSFDPKQFREYVDSVLKFLNPVIPYSRNARELLVLTAAAETEIGNNLWQIGGTMQDGPARGIFQMEEATEADLLNYLERRPELKAKVDLARTDMGDDDLIDSLPYQTMLARIFYWRKPEPLPDASDPYALGAYWKKHFNTYLGKGRIIDAVGKYLRLAGKYEEA